MVIFVLLQIVSLTEKTSARRVCTPEPVTSLPTTCARVGIYKNARAFFMRNIWNCFRMTIHCCQLTRIWSLSGLLRTFYGHRKICLQAVLGAAKNATLLHAPSAGVAFTPTQVKTPAPAHVSSRGQFSPSKVPIATKRHTIVSSVFAWSFAAGPPSVFLCTFLRVFVYLIGKKKLCSRIHCFSVCGPLNAPGISMEECKHCRPRSFWNTAANPPTCSGFIAFAAHHSWVAFGHIRKILFHVCHLAWQLKTRFRCIPCCSDCDTNCAVCLDDGTCQTCNAGFYADGQTCRGEVQTRHTFLSNLKHKRMHSHVIELQTEEHKIRKFQSGIGFGRKKYRLTQLGTGVRDWSFKLIRVNLQADAVYPLQ